MKKFIKKAGIWEDIPTLNLQRLSRMIQYEEFDQKVRKGLMNFAEEQSMISVKLVKKRKRER